MDNVWNNSKLGRDFWQVINIIIEVCDKTASQNCL